MTDSQNNVAFTNDILKTKAIYLTKMTVIGDSFTYCQIEMAKFKHYVIEMFLIFLTYFIGTAFVLNK